MKNLFDVAAECAKAAIVSNTLFDGRVENYALETLYAGFALAEISGVIVSVVSVEYNPNFASKKLWYAAANLVESAIETVYEGLSATIFIDGRIIISISNSREYNINDMFANSIQHQGLICRTPIDVRNALLYLRGGLDKYADEIRLLVEDSQRIHDSAHRAPFAYERRIGRVRIRENLEQHKLEWDEICANICSLNVGVVEAKISSVSADFAEIVVTKLGRSETLITFAARINATTPKSVSFSYKLGVYALATRKVEKWVYPADFQAITDTQRLYEAVQAVINRALTFGTFRKQIEVVAYNSGFHNYLCFDSGKLCVYSERTLNKLSEDSVVTGVGFRLTDKFDNVRCVVGWDYSIVPGFDKYGRRLPEFIRHGNSNLIIYDREFYDVVGGEYLSAHYTLDVDVYLKLKSLSAECCFLPSDML